jgi:hypothetical protein
MNRYFHISDNSWSTTKLYPVPYLLNIGTEFILHRSAIRTWCLNIVKKKFSPLLWRISGYFLLTVRELFEMEMT